MPQAAEQKQETQVSIWIGVGGYQFFGIRISSPLEPVLRVEMVIPIGAEADGRTKFLRSGDVRPLDRRSWEEVVLNPAEQQEQGKIHKLGN